MGYNSYVFCFSWALKYHQYVFNQPKVMVKNKCGEEDAGELGGGGGGVGS